MEKYVALLRGINVGGKNKISMTELKIAFEESGFLNVKTYINSGNIIFSSNTNDETKLMQICEKIILEKFNLNIAVCIISADDLICALNNAPDWWDNMQDSKHNAIFVIMPALAKDIIKIAGDIKPEYEKVDYFGQVIFWSAPIETFSKTRWSNIVSTGAYKNITIRNANTAKNLLKFL